MIKWFITLNCVNGMHSHLIVIFILIKEDMSTQPRRTCISSKYSRRHKRQLLGVDFPLLLLIVFNCLIVFNTDLEMYQSN